MQSGPNFRSQTGVFCSVRCQYKNEAYRQFDRLVGHTKKLRARCLFPGMIFASRFSIYLFASVAARAATFSNEQIDFFEAKIRPVLASECYECHNAKKQKGGLRLDYRDGWKRGGESGEVIIP